MRKLITTVVGLFLIVSSLIAQVKITGKVAEASGAGIPNVSVSAGTSKGTSTKFDGTFALELKTKPKTLTFSSIGFETKTIEVTDETSYSVVLVPAEAKKGDDVIVTGYTKRKKKDEAGAITTVRGSDINDQAVVSIDKALQGAAPGVTVQANNGIPGGAIRVNIRGLSSFGSGTAPLWVIDGIPFPSGSISNNTQTNPLAFINQSDIESIDILKDAASTAIYGSSGANGVILVTTKKGKNQKTRINFTHYRGTNSPLKKMDVLNTQDFVKFRREAVNNANNLTTNTPLTAQQLQAATLNGIEVNLLTGLPTATIAGMSLTQLDSLTTALPNTDWQSTVFRPGDVVNYELTLNGGNEKTQFYTSASYQSSNSIINKVDFKRGAIKVDVTNAVTNKLKVNFNAFLSATYQNAPFATSGSFLGNPAFSGAGILPHNPIYNRDGSYFSIASGKNLMGLLSHNVVAVNEYNTAYDNTKQAVANVSLEYKLIPWLTLRMTGGIDYRINNGRLFRDPRTPDGAGVAGRGISSANWFINAITNHSLIFNKTLGGKHNFDGVVGFEYINRRSEGISAEKTGFTTFQLPLLTSGGVLVASNEYRSDSKKASLFGNINYNYDRRYSVGFTVRRDGSSRFGENNQFGNFWSAKAVWNVDKEKFFNVKNFSTLRIRGSYGKVGNDIIGDYDALGTYGSGAVYNNAPGIFPNRLASSNLTWETVRETNLGLDLGFFNDRVTLSTDIYEKNTEGILQNVTLPQFSGWSSVRQNTGKLQNRGIEVALNAQVLAPRDASALRWTVGFNFAYNDNKIIDIINGTETLDRNTSVLLGKPLGQVLSNRYAGVNSATGRAMWLDSLGNLTYIVQAKDRYYAGIGAGGLPPFTGGASTTIAYKGFSLDAQLSYQYGQIIGDGQYNFLMETIGRINTLYENFDNRWTTPGQITSVPRPNTGGEPNGSGAGGGDRFLQKTDFIRLRSVTLAYDFNPAVLQKLKLANGRFYIQGGNLWTYTSFKGYDPEFVDVSTGIVPQSKNFTVGLNIGF